jgi:NADH:quinone reductase (non-electrogenic)
MNRESTEGGNTAMGPEKNIVIVGGGFAGTTLARALDGKLPSGCRLMIISEESHTTFNPMLPEALGASIFPEHVVAPIREMIDRARFVMGRVVHIDHARRIVTASTLAGEIAFAYEHVVLAFGNRARLDLIPGLEQHALPLKTVGDAMHIRNVVLRRIAQIELESDPDLRRRLGHFVVVGGGFSGVETAGALIDCLHGIHRYYRLVAADELKVTLLHDGPRLLPELPEGLGIAAHRSLARRGVDVRVGVRATFVCDKAVVLGDRTRIATSTVICTIGTRPNPLVERMVVPQERGRIVVNPDLSVCDTPGVWAVGDCARVVNAHDAKVAPATAQFAVREARHAAASILAVLRGSPTRAFSYRARGSMAAIGHVNGVAEVFGIHVSGFPAWLLWRAYYLSQMPTLRRKLRIFVEWTWGMFFPTDITHLRFTRSHELDARTARSDAAREMRQVA